MYVRKVEVMIIYDHNLKVSDNSDILLVFDRNESDFHVIKCIFIK